MSMGMRHLFTTSLGTEWDKGFIVIILEETPGVSFFILYKKGHLDIRLFYLLIMTCLSFKRYYWVRLKDLFRIGIGLFMVRG